MIVQFSVAAGTAVVGYDLMSASPQSRYAKWPRPRRIRAIGVAGSAAAGDCSFDLYVNGVRVGTFYNLATGWPTRDHILPQNIPVPANAQIEAIVTDAPTSNPINVVMDVG